MKHGAPLDHYDARVAEDLEFDVVQEMLGELAGCPSSEKRASELVPSKDRFWVVRRLQETDEMQRIRSGGHGFPLLEFDELHREIKLLGVRESVLDEAGFRRISTASRSAFADLARSSCFTTTLARSATSTCFFSAMLCLRTRTAWSA